MNESVCSLPQDRVVIALAFDCVEQMVYWTDITGPAISKASVSGGDVIPVVTKGTTDVRAPDRGGKEGVKNTNSPVSLSPVTGSELFFSLSESLRILCQ